jgi:hypothetical protein
MQPNAEQIQSLIRLLLGAGGPLAAMLISKGVAGDTVNQIETLALAIVPPLVSLIWGLIRHSDAGTAKAASQLPGVKVVVDPAAAAAAVVAVAKSDNAPDVVIAKAA